MDTSSHTVLPSDCVGVILSHVDEPALREFRLVAKWCCELVAMAAKLRAGSVKVKHKQFDQADDNNSMVKIRVAQNWEIRVIGSIGDYHWCAMRRVDRGIVKEVLKLQPQNGCVWYPRIRLYISYKERLT